MLASELEKSSRSRSARSRRQILRLMAYNFLRCEEFLADKHQLGSQDLATIEGMVWPVIGDLFRHGNLRGKPIADECLKLMNLVRNGVYEQVG